MTDPISDALLEQLWTLLSDADPDTISRSVGPMVAANWGPTPPPPMPDPIRYPITGEPIGFSV